MYSDITDCFVKSGLSLLNSDTENDNQSMHFTNVDSNSIQSVFSTLKGIGFEPSRYVPQILLMERDIDRVKVLMQNWYLSSVPLKIEEWYHPYFNDLKVVISTDSLWIDNIFEIWDKKLLQTRIQIIAKPGGILGTLDRIGKYYATRKQYLSLSARKHNYYRQKQRKSEKKGGNKKGL